MLRKKMKGGQEKQNKEEVRKAWGKAKEGKNSKRKVASRIKSQNSVEKEKPSANKASPNHPFLPCILINFQMTMTSLIVNT